MTANVMVLFVLAAPGDRPASRPLDSQRYLRSAVLHYERLNYEKALEQLEKSQATATNPLDESSAVLMAGVVLADWGRIKRAEAAFSDGFAIDVEAKLPISTSPKIAAMAERVRLRARRLLAAQRRAQPLRARSFSVCAEADGGANRIWNEAIKAQVLEKLESSPQRRISAVAAGQVERLEAWAYAWADQQLATCLRREVHRSLSKVQASDRERCLANGSAAFSALIEFLTGPGELESPSIELTKHLPDPVDCVQVGTESADQIKGAERARVHLAQARAALDLFRLEAARERYELAVTSIAEAPNPLLKAELKAFAGKLYRREQDIDKAIAAHQEAVASAIEANATRAAVASLYELIDLQGGRRRDFAAARKSYLWAQRLLARIPEPASLEVQVLVMWSHVLLESGSFKEALTALEMARRRHQQLESSVLTNRWLAVIYLRMGGARYELGRGVHSLDNPHYAKALEDFEKSAELIAKSVGPNAPELMAARSNLGGMYIQLTDDLQKAEKILESAIQVAENLQWPAGKVDAYVNLGHVYRITNRLELARQYATSALEWGEKKWGPTHRALSETLTLLGTIEREMGFPEKALERRSV